MHTVATAGHVDHGKSLLLSRLTGMEPDRWDEERRRGLTIDLGYVWTTLDAPGSGAVVGSGAAPGSGAVAASGSVAASGPVTVAFVDVPGHDHFLPNMLCGVGVVDLALLVVAADDGWAAQSEEHLRVLDLLGVRGVLVAVTKRDLVDDARVAQVVDEVARRVAGTSLAGAPVVAVDAVTGRGLDEVRRVLAARLAATPPAPGRGPARLWVDRVFTVRGAGTVATGTLVDGTLAEGARLAVLPGGRPVRVRGLQCLGAPVTRAGAGSRVAVNVAGAEVADLGRGDVLVGVDADGRPEGLATDALDVVVTALPDAAVDRPGAWHLHLGTAARTVRVVPLLGPVGPGDDGVVRLVVDTPVPARVGERFVLRESGRRIVAGGGTVLDPDPGPRSRGPDARLAHALRLDGLAAAGPVLRLGALVDAHGGARPRASAQASLGVGAARTDQAAEAAGLVVLADHLLAGATHDRWLDAVERAAEDTTDPGRAVATDRLVRAAGAAGCPPALRRPLVDAAVAAGRLVAVDGRHVHHGHAARHRAARRARQAAFVERLARDGLALPDPAAAADEVGVEPGEVRALVAAGRLVACGQLLVPPAIVEGAVALLARGPGAGGAGFTAAAARDAWGTSRRCAVPLLEHLAATGATRFDGERHHLVDVTASPRGPRRGTSDGRATDGPGQA